MGKTHKISCAGFGGQGVMSMGQLLTYAGMIDGKEVSWVPAYGPEMRGGTANCSVIVSDDPIGSPIFDKGITTSVVMNLPSFRKFVPKVASGGSIFVNSSIVSEKVDRDDVNVYYIPVNDLANELGNGKLINIIMLGAVIEIDKIVESESVIKAFLKVFGDDKAKFIPINREALSKGAEVAKTLKK
jgi:Pyruvate:ferredoxin oxidoreductase and related 2-oxoacid:ferredoxin oxidoreductases, gamma subunit